MGYVIGRDTSARMWVLGVWLAALLGWGLCAPAIAATDLAVVPLFDDKQSEPMNTWGGYWSVGHAQPDINLRVCDMPAGRHALRLELSRVQPAEKRYLQCFASGFGRSREYYQTRDMTRYQRLRFRVQNVTGVPLHGALQLKDYRDTPEHSVTYHYELSSRPDWGLVDIPLAPGAAGRTLHGQPDLSRILAVDFIFEAQRAIAAGQIYLQDITLVEPGGPAGIDSSPLFSLVERLARRQWDGLLAAHNRAHGLIPNNSYQATDAGLNTTAAVLWMLPAATRRHWVEKDVADRYVQLVVGTIDRLLDGARHLPPRYVDWATLKPSLLPEESTVDAAFLALALYQYESWPSTPQPLRQAIDRTRNRFDFAAFGSPAGWRMAYRYQTPCCPEGFIRCTYNGYTSEGSLISLAAHLTHAHAVTIEKHWNSSANRVRAGLVASQGAPVVHQMAEFRSPFTQALWNLFVDVRQRGVDTYPDNRLAVNPWQNFVCYEQNVLARLAELGRPWLVQPDAGDDGSLCCYQPFSVYDSYGRSDLFMPWSAGIALLSGVDRAEPALRFLLEHRLCDVFGLADSARWTTGAAEPYAVAARHDFWNTSLSTMALLEWLDGPQGLSRSFAALPEVRAALDRVFPAEQPNHNRISAITAVVSNPR